MAKMPGVDDAGSIATDREVADVEEFTDLNPGAAEVEREGPYCPPFDIVLDEAKERVPEDADVTEL